MAETGVVLRTLERGYLAMLRGYERSLETILRHPRSTLAVTVATIGLSGYLFYVIPKGLFPVEDTGFLTVATEAAVGGFLSFRLSRTPVAPIP